MSAGWELALAVGSALAVVAMMLGGWFSWTAGRLDRMHLRVEAARAALETSLQRRAAVAAELAVAGVGDPASSLALLEAARAARETEDGGVEPDRWLAESELTAVLQAVELPPPEVDELSAELVDAGRRAALARRIHNDLATTTRRLHQRRRVRWFRLAGYAVPPEPIDFDDRYDVT